MLCFDGKFELKWPVAVQNDTKHAGVLTNFINRPYKVIPGSVKVGFSLNKTITLFGIILYRF